MQLYANSDVAYLVLPNAKSHITGYFFLSKKYSPPSTPDPVLDGSILDECKALKHVVASVVEAKTAALFHNGQTAMIISCILEALRHKQSIILIKIDNSTAYSFVNDMPRQKRSKSSTSCQYTIEVYLKKFSLVRGVG